MSVPSSADFQSTSNMVDSNSTTPKGPIRVSLVNEEDFKAYLPNIMEQKLSSKGKVLFPEPIFNISGLDNAKEYKVSLRFDQECDDKFTYKKDKFVKTGKKSKASSRSEIFDHPEIIEKDQDSKETEVEFHVRLTNSASNSDNKIQLDSLCKYRGVLIVTEIVKDSIGFPQHNGSSLEFTFDCFRFITTTTYCSKHVLEVKCTSNPNARWTPAAKRLAESSEKIVSKNLKQSSTPIHQESQNNAPQVPCVPLSTQTHAQNVPPNSYMPVPTGNDSQQKFHMHHTANQMMFPPPPPNYMDPMTHTNTMWYHHNGPLPTVIGNLPIPPMNFHQQNYFANHCLPPHSFNYTAPMQNQQWQQPNMHYNNHHYYS